MTDLHFAAAGRVITWQQAEIGPNRSVNEVEVGNF
jgi:hypothetical protein